MIHDVANLEIMMMQVVGGRWSMSKTYRTNRIRFNEDFAELESWKWKIDTDRSITEGTSLDGLDA